MRVLAFAVGFALGLASMAWMFGDPMKGVESHG